MQTVPQSPACDALDAERVEYYRAVASYAELVNNGVDLRGLVEGSEYVLSLKLVRLVPSISVVAAVLTELELYELAQRMGRDAARSVRTTLAVAVARHCLSQDVIKCVAKYHDEEIAEFWLIQTAA